MEHQQKQSVLVLKYDKRRFDGGMEIDQIRHIERRQSIAQMERMTQPHSLLETSMQTVEAPPTDNAPVQAPAEAQTQKRTHKVLDACIVGPLAICIGVVGILTACLAILMFTKMDNQPLLAQARTIMNDCVKSLKKGIVDTLTTPIRVFALITTRA
jgi:hypothetical protein